MSLLSTRQARLFAAMSRFLHGIAQEAAEELNGYGLTPAQFQMLVAIRAHPGTAQKDLADVFGVTRGNISQLVKKGEEAGHLRRLRNQGTDELELTEEGSRLLDEVVPAHDRFMERAFAGLTEREQDELGALMKRLTKR